MRKNEENSFGMGIWPKGNTPVKVKLEDWGVAVNKNDGKARVWGFEVIGQFIPAAEHCFDAIP